MSVVCIVCQDMVTERPQALDRHEELIIVALQCGHIFHRCCIAEWFIKLGDPNGKCPCCKSFGILAQALRLYPAGDEEGQALAEKIKKAKEQSEELKHLKHEMLQINQILEETACQLENEKLMHEVLRIEHAQKNSEINDQRRQSYEQTTIFETKEQIWKNVVDNLSKERDDAKNQLRESEEHYAQEFNKYESKIAELEKNLEIERANKDSTKLRMIEEAHLKEIRGLEKQLTRKLTFEKSCQTDGRDAALLQARLVSYKSCLMHMQSEVRVLESEYEDMQKVQQVDTSLGGFLLNDALNKSIDLNLDDDDDEDEKFPDKSNDEADALNPYGDNIVVNNYSSSSSVVEGRDLVSENESKMLEDVGASSNDEFCDAIIWE